MPPMLLYNTLTRKVEPVTPRVPGKVRLYYCGPTVYDVPHVGHVRSAVVFDVLTRTLRSRGLEVTQVRNITDVDDKILNRARENGESPLDLSRRMADIYREDMAAVGCLAPDHEPTVSGHIPQIVRLVEELVRRDAAYVVDMPEGTRDVYFSVRRSTGYGKLSRRKLDELVAGARVEADEKNKRDPLDFALWKGALRGEWGWESPWGFGRPGWHTECVAMSLEYLGHGFEIHGGGMDLIFPHHENEVAQGESANPHAGVFAQCWVHNGFVNVDKEKMSKSLGNFVTARDVFARNDPGALRLFLLGVHYRGPIQFDTETLPSGRVIFPGVDEAERRLDYLYTTRERLRGLGDAGVTVPAKLPRELVQARDAGDRAREKADEALADDLNTSVALAELGEIAKLANEVSDLALRRKQDPSFQGASAVVGRALDLAMSHVAEQLGLLTTGAVEYRARTSERRLAVRGLTAADVQARVDARVEARRTKDFARSDVLRAELETMGVSLHDGPGGTTWSVAV